MIFVTGDMHGVRGIRRLSSGYFDQDGLARSDYVVVLGDFGLIWRDPPSDEECAWLRWLEERSCTTLFIDGNHENHSLLSTYPIERWHGGNVHRISEHVLHLMRGEIFDIEGHAFFCIGGAHSTDKCGRTPGRTWWPEEVPSESERAHARETLAAAGWKADYILTHCPPTRAFEIFRLLGCSYYKRVDEYTDWLDREIADKVTFERWFFGHMHIDAPDERPFTPLYESFFKLT